MRDCTGSMKVCASAAGLVVAALLLGACGSSDETSAPRTGREIYVASCQTCHGRQGEGFVGPTLVDVAVRYPDVADEISLVMNGAGEMPGWGGRLTTEEITTVVEYTRRAFASASATTSTTAQFVGPT